MSDISKAVQFMISIAQDDTHGYDQAHRNGPDYDCSSLVGTALHNAGFNVSPASTTRNLEKQLRNCGFVDCSAPWKAGDVHLKVGYHVVMSINSSQIAHASINEKGTVTGGQTGDQTGKEICIRDYYNYSGGWDMHLRYPTENTSKSNTENTSKSIDEIAKEVIAGKWGNGDDRKNKLASAGYDYTTVQAKVNSLLSNNTSTSTTNNTSKSNTEIAKEVIAGKWGNGEERKSKLTAAGYDYATIQGIVNSLLLHNTSETSKSNMEIAREVIKGLWGNGEERKSKLNAAGYDYATIQNLVNQILK